MGKGWAIEGAKAPLFDRMRDTDSLVYLDKAQLQASVLHELQNLFTTRACLTSKGYQTLKPLTLKFGTPQLYGLPDFSFFQPEDKVSWNHTAAMIQNAIRLFEPRLLSPQVQIQSFDGSTQDLFVEVRGHLLFGEIVEPICFPLSIDISKASGGLK